MGTRKASLDLKRRIQDATPDERALLLDGMPYEVGFGKPPKQSRFQPGQSGNGRGRPKGTKNLSTIVKEELWAPVEVTDRGKRHKLPKVQVAVRQQVNAACANNPKAFAAITELLRRTGQFDKTETVQASPIDARDLEAAVELLRFLGQIADVPPSDEPKAA